MRWKYDGGALRALSSIAFVLLVQSSASAQPTPSDEKAYLDALQGTWRMEGSVGRKPVRYRAEGQRVLQGGFLELHMTDVGTPPLYEADAFIGYDAKANDYVAHWLDRFGAAGARVVAHGQRHGAQLVLEFPYAEGAFRDTFTWRPESGSWTILMETQAGDGAWSTFATYTLTRGTPR